MPLVNASDGLMLGIARGYVEGWNCNGTRSFREPKCGAEDVACFVRSRVHLVFSAWSCLRSARDCLRSLVRLVMSESMASRSDLGSLPTVRRRVLMRR